MVGYIFFVVSCQCSWALCDKNNKGTIFYHYDVMRDVCVPRVRGKKYAAVNSTNDRPFVTLLKHFVSSP